MIYWAKCTECGEEQEVKSNADLPNMCEHCLSIDTLEELDDE